MTSLDLPLPDRPAKPRATGRTAIIDRGMGLAAVDDLIATASDMVDLVKIGWGTAVVDRLLEERIERYRAVDVDVCFGGTLFELCAVTDRLDHYRSWLLELELQHVEISDGTVTLRQDEKLRAIERFADDFTVYSEVGSKDADAIVSPRRWVEAIRRDFEAGASYVILEGRETASAGMYRPSGEIRTGLIDEILDEGIDPARLVFEAPVKAAQVFLLRLLGPNVNLANIAADDVVALETLRLGLRSDTLLDVHGG